LDIESASLGKFIGVEVFAIVSVIFLAKIRNVTELNYCIKKGASAEAKKLGYKTTVVCTTIPYNSV